MNRRLARRILITVLIAGSGTLTALAPSMTASASTLPRAASPGVAAQPVYPLPKDVRHMCQAPKPGRAACLALVRTSRRHLAAPRRDLFQDPYGPDALRSAYVLPASGGDGQTVAIVDAYDEPSLESDLAAYRSYYGLPPCTTANGCFRKVNEGGQQGNYPKPDPGWGGEESLDVDMVSAACPACHILVVEASSNDDNHLSLAEITAIQSGARFISNSWGSSAPIAGWPDHPGIVVTASSGDEGYVVEYPAGDSATVAVGGTSLLPAANPRGWAEIAWPGGGSGCSAQPKPSWQADTGCAGRTVADVAAVADPDTGVAIYDSDPNGPTLGWGEVGGTSVSSPLMAAVYALAGAPGLNAGAATLYANHSSLNDIVAGMNAPNGCSPTYLCTAGPGYDGPTGWGTPEGLGAFIPGTGARITVMGDSYSAGEGDGSYDPGSDTPIDICHRSPYAFGRVYAATYNLVTTHTACSGAVIDNLLTVSQYGEAPQIDAIDPQSKMITLTIGGNDAGFAAVLTHCVLRLGCQSYYTQNDANNLDNVIDGLRPRLADAYRAIQARAPGAKVVAVTYPYIFNPDKTCGGVAYLAVSDLAWLWSQTSHLDDVIVTAAHDAGITVLDARAAFTGTISHLACDSDPWIYTLPIPFPSGTQVTDNKAWFHPTPPGHAALASLLISSFGPPAARPVSVPPGHG